MTRLIAAPAASSNSRPRSLVVERFTGGFVVRSLGLAHADGFEREVLHLRGLLVESVRKVELLAALPRLTVIRIARQQREQRRQLAEDHLLVDDVHLAPRARLAEGRAAEGPVA